jgi:transposase
VASGFRVGESTVRGWLRRLRAALPLYSPDRDPIEPAWSKLKALLRGAGACTDAALHAALTTLVDAITATDTRGYFRRCGHAVHRAANRARNGHTHRSP